jgi:endonuclease G, mitochondrial
MANIFASTLDALVESRVAAASDQIEKSLKQIAAGNPLGAEGQNTRMVDRLQVKAGVPRQQAEALAAGIEATARAVETGREPAPSPDGREAIWGSTLDFLGVNFLARGRRAADAVARVAFRDGRPQGTGFLVAPGLFITNNHVVSSAVDAAQFCAEFDYETGPTGETLPVTRFSFDPARCFVFDRVDALDFTLIALGDRIYGDRALEEYGFLALSDAADKHMLGEVANIVQHPQGRMKEVVLRENQLVARDELNEVLHYIADTEAGASGSPVFNNQWEPIALHHWGAPWREGRSASGVQREVNEGIRISAIVKFLRAAAPGLSGPAAELVRSALKIWQAAPRGSESAAPPRASGAGDRRPATDQGPRIDPDGRVTWTIPIELSLRLPGDLSASRAPVVPEQIPAAPRATGAAAERRGAQEDFSDRNGYEPGFIPGFIAPLPKIAATHRAARNLLAASGDDPHELRYHHFSIVMNADRRLAFFTACNIDGASIKAINRQDKTVIDDPTLDDLGVESLGAEASDAFRPDPRVAPGEQMTREFYEAQKIAGFPDPRSRDRIARIFQKGHITLRGDPAWGVEEMAVAAERDTFFYTNAAPQVGYFNQGSRLDHPGEKGKLRWRAVETYVLRNAVAMRQRVTVFAGPIFKDDDPEYRFGARVPMKFWKIAIWADPEGLRAIALVADQAKVLEVMPEGIGPEAFLDDAEVARVAEFLTTVAELEAETGLDFGAAVRAADVRAGAQRENVVDGGSADPLRPGRRRSAPARALPKPAAPRKRGRGRA